MRRIECVIMVVALALSACGKKDGQESAGVQAPQVPVTGQSPGKEDAQRVETAVDESPPAQRPAGAQIAGGEQTAASDSGRPVAAPDEAAPVDGKMLALAQASGCLACHRVESKLVGPAWRDVADRYRGDAGARERLIEKVKQGGKGNWTEVTGGATMPPYSPRVADEKIEELVAFVLSLE